MWLFTWMLSLLPDSVFVWITYMLFGLGLALYVASKLVAWIPVLLQYRLPAELGGVLLLIVGAYLFGVHDTEMTWQARVKEMEAKVAVAEAKARQVNTVIQEKIVTRIKTIKETVYVNKEIVREVAGTQLDNQCTLPKSTVVLHDSASRNEVARGPSSTDGTPSGIEAHRLLDRVIENYGACYENAEKLKAWQEWYRAQKQIFEEVR